MEPGGGTSLMDAVYITRFGGPETLQFGSMPDPDPGQGEVVVDIRAASVNAADWKVRSGHASDRWQLPHILGRDFSGIVAAAGPDCDLAIGEAVFGVCPTGTEGAYATRIAIEADRLARKPESLSHVEAAAIALTGLTALISLVDTIELSAGERILVQGGAGGVGGMAVQIARQLGAYVLATGRGCNREYVEGLGADQLLDYEAGEVETAAGVCDAALDTVGGTTISETFASLKTGGRAAFISEAEAPPAPRRDIVSLRPQVARHRRHLDRLLDFVTDERFLMPNIATFPLSKAADAHRLSESGHVRGKLVLLP